MDVGERLEGVVMAKNKLNLLKEPSQHRKV